MDYDQEYQFAIKLKELARHDTSTPVVNILDNLFDEDSNIINKYGSHYPGRLTAKKHRNPKWRKAKKK